MHRLTGLVEQIDFRSASATRMVFWQKGVRKIEEEEEEEEEDDDADDRQDDKKQVVLMKNQKFTKFSSGKQVARRWQTAQERPMCVQCKRRMSLANRANGANECTGTVTSTKRGTRKRVKKQEEGELICREHILI